MCKMLNNVKKNNNIIFISVLYMVVLFVELFHFGSDVNIIIMSESFLCFSILIYLLSFSLQDIFSVNNYKVAVKYNYIYMFFENLVNLDIHVHKNFINIFSYFLFFLIKNVQLHINFKNILKGLYAYAFISLCKKIDNVNTISNYKYIVENNLIWFI